MDEKLDGNDGMECKANSQVIPKYDYNGPNRHQTQGDPSQPQPQPPINDMIVLYDFDSHGVTDEYNLPIDAIVLNGSSQYIFKVSLIVLPIIFIIVIIIGIFERDQQSNQLRCKIGRVFIVLAISAILLAFYLLCRFSSHIKSLYRAVSGNHFRRQHNHTEVGTENLKRCSLSKKELKFILQNPWHIANNTRPKTIYSNHIDVYVENGLYGDHTKN